jgi:Skp family chaperone for outer membrane proteins
MTNYYKVLFLLIFLGLWSHSATAQKSIRIGYVDTEYILENIPDYQEATSQLNQKISKWKLEAESRLKEIEQMKKQLENESVLMTKELYDERMEEILFEESEVLNFQEKRFGPNGDVVLQKRQLMQPIQDQIYAAVQDIAERRKYDFIFDKNSDFLMLYSAERYDISDLVIRTITRADRRKQANSFEERKALREEEALDERSFEEIEREAQATAQQARRDSLLADRRAQREADLAERKRKQDSAREARRLEAEARRQKVLDERNARSQTEKSSDSTAQKAVSTAAVGAAATVASSEKTQDSSKTGGQNSALKVPDSEEPEKTAAELQEERRQAKLKEREERRKELEARKQKILEQRRKAREERELKAKRADSIAKARKEENKEETENEEN